MKTMTDLYEAQKTLDALIVAKRGLEGKDLLHDKVLALNESLGKLAAAWRGHHYWAEDREPLTEVEYGACDQCTGTGIGKSNEEDCPQCGGGGEVVRNPLLDAYVECLSRALSIAVEMGYEDEIYSCGESLEGSESYIINELHSMVANFTFWKKEEHRPVWFRAFMSIFLTLGYERLDLDFDEFAQVFHAQNEADQIWYGGVTA